MPSLLEIGASFDIISPMAHLFGGLVHGAGHTFNISSGCGWSGNDIEKLLRKRGVQTWGLMMVGGDILIKVPRAQAAQAQGILEQNGITIQGGMVEASKPSKRQSSQPAQQAREPEEQSQGDGSWMSSLWPW